jgi:phenylpropionate dioxygenase-like ring-hydroxylating dioxygenase large terminal subunit
LHTREENEYMTRIGPGTPMGELFRRFWLPALLSEELPNPDSVPVRVRLLGEDLIAFRDSDGRVGLLDAFCPHRNAPLFFGRNEESGLRCVYHGWKFDVDGTCVDLPNAAEGAVFKDKVHIISYPTFEGGGMVWAYMGPRDQVPPHPGYEWLSVPDDHVYVRKYLINCNYLQSLENEFDIGHSSFLHSTLNPATSQSQRMIAQSEAARTLVTASMARGRLGNFDIYDTEYGSASARRLEDGRLALSSHFILPSFSTAGAVSAPNTNPLNLKVPIDDENTVFFRLKWSPEPLKPEVVNVYKHANHEFPDQIPGSFLTASNKSNDYNIDRNMQRNFNYTGMHPYPVQDFAVTENQRGPIADRSRETLVSSDRYLIHVRRRLMQLARQLEAGQEPQEPWHPEAYAGIRNFRVLEPEAEQRLAPVHIQQQPIAAS